jgi:acyl-CoA reductase-like NAD-dependent aldehyde dehydrogenase
MVNDLSTLIPALQAAKKSLAALEPVPMHLRLARLEKLAEGWGIASKAELAALALESGLSAPLVQAWDFSGGRAFLESFCSSVFHLQIPVGVAPRGVIAILSPRFHGLRLFLERFAPAYLAGNPVVVKMSSKTPTASVLVEAWLRAAGITETDAVVVGGGSTDYASLLVKHPAISAVSAVGRREVLLSVYQECAALGRSFQGFAGGRSTMLVLEMQTADGWRELLGSSLLDGRGQRPYDNLRVFVLEKDEKQQLENLTAAMSDFPNARVSGHLTQCSEDHQAEALGPVVLFSSVKYPFDIAKWVNNAASGFAVQLFGPVERLEKIAPKLEVGLILANQNFDPAQALLFGVKESVMGNTNLSPWGDFYSQVRTWRAP